MVSPSLQHPESSSFPVCLVLPAGRLLLKQAMASLYFSFSHPRSFSFSRALRRQPHPAMISPYYPLQHAESSSSFPLQLRAACQRPPRRCVFVWPSCELGLGWLVSVKIFFVSNKFRV